MPLSREGCSKMFPAFSQVLKYLPKQPSKTPFRKCSMAEINGVD